MTKELMGLVLLSMLALGAACPQQATMDKLKFTLCKGQDSVHIDIDADDAYHLAKPLNKQISGAVVIPSTYKNLPVTHISGFGGCRAITSVSTSATVILDDAFNGCTGLTSVNLPDWMYYIGKRAFANCPNLTSVTVPGQPGSDYDGGFYLKFHPDAFDGDFSIVYNNIRRRGAIRAETYTRQAGGKHWTRQDSAKSAQPGQESAPGKPWRPGWHG